MVQMQYIIDKKAIDTCNVARIFGFLKGSYIPSQI